MSDQPKTEADKAIQLLAEADLGYLNDLKSKAQINIALGKISEFVNAKKQGTDRETDAKPDYPLDSKLYALGLFVRAHELYDKVETKYYDIVVFKGRVDNLVDWSRGWKVERNTASCGDLIHLVQVFDYGHPNVP